MESNINSVEMTIGHKSRNKKKETPRYISTVEEWAKRNGYDRIEYEYDSFTDDGEHLYQCIMKINGISIDGFGVGNDKAEAKKESAKDLYQRLVSSGYSMNEYMDAVGEADPDRALAQIKELAQKGLIENPSYIFDKKTDKNGQDHRSSRFKCRIHVFTLLG